MAELGLNDHHQSSIVNYMRFARSQRQQRTRTIDRCFQDVKVSRLLTEDTFTKEEVTEMLDGLSSVVMGEVESELINMTHTNILLLRQMFSQAEHWHLKLQADIGELENKELLDQVKSFEDHEIHGIKKDGGSAPMAKPRLEPVMDAGSSQLLQNEIGRLREENERLKDRMKNVETKATSIIEEKTRLASDLHYKEAELSGLKNLKPEVNKEEIDELQKQMTNVKMEMTKTLEMSDVEKSKLSNDLVSTKHKLLEIQEQLEMAEKELDKKFQKTAAYANMKKMLMKKNDQIKELRQQLKKYEPQDGGDAAMDD